VWSDIARAVELATPTWQALDTIMTLCHDSDHVGRAAIVAAGAIPPLVLLLGSASAYATAGAWLHSWLADKRSGRTGRTRSEQHRDQGHHRRCRGHPSTGATAGAWLALRLLACRSRQLEHCLLGTMRSQLAGNNAVIIVDAGAIQPLVKLLGPRSTAETRQFAAGLLFKLRGINAATRATIDAAGATHDVLYELLVSRPI
jgi:hypothetical protein